MNWLRRQWVRFTTFFLGLLAAVGLGVVSANPIVDRVSWVNATQLTDGSAVPAGGIAKTVVQWGTSINGPFNGGQAEVNFPGTEVTFTRPAPGFGTRCYVAYHVTPSGQVGEPSPAVCKSVVAPLAAPSNIRVE
ncbi:MAG: hypothetical protein ACK52I_37825 [Pseudomonadota bacterium]|jgi:hypothetical protein